jgi:predicted transcriptional regulator
MDDGSKQPELLAQATEIVAAFVGNNTVAVSDLPALISNVFQALHSTGQVEAEKSAEAPIPAVPIRKSVGQDFIVCLEDGKKLKMLKRHLATRYSMWNELQRPRVGRRARLDGKVEKVDFVPPILPSARAPLSGKAYEEARRRFPGYDVYFVEQEWRDWSADKEAPQHPDKAFLAFFATYAERHSL